MVIFIFNAITSMSQTVDNKTIEDFLKFNLPLFLSLSILDVPFSGNVVVSEDIYSGGNSLMIKQGGHLRPIFPLKRALLHFHHNLENNETIKKPEDKLPKAILVELKRNEVTNNAIRDAVIFELVQKLKKIKKKNYFLIVRNTLPIVNKWLDNLTLSYNPLNAEFQGDWNGKVIDYSLLNICIECFKKFNGSIPDDNLCREKRSIYEPNCHSIYRAWLERSQKSDKDKNIGVQTYVNSARTKLLMFYLLDFSKELRLKELSEVQKDIESIAEIFKGKILRKKRILGNTTFSPFFNPEEDEYYPADEDSQKYKELVSGIREKNKNIIQGLINKYKLKTYEINRLLFKYIHINNVREKILKGDPGFIELIFSSTHNRLQKEQRQRIR